MFKKKSRLVLSIILVVVFLAYLAIIVLLLFNINLFEFQKPLREKILRGVTWFEFGKNQGLQGWEEKIFKGRVIYSVITERKEGYLNAYSKDAASGLVHWLKFNPREKPFVSWKWKVLKFPDKTSGKEVETSWIEKDDYAARFYVIFPRFPFFRIQTLEYVWSKDIPKGTVLTNPSFSNLKIIVAESGPANLNKWVTVERNIQEDFKNVFGTLPGNAGGIALMTDSENTVSVAEAQYNDIEVGYVK